MHLVSTCFRDQCKVGYYPSDHHIEQYLFWLLVCTCFRCFVPFLGFYTGLVFGVLYSGPVFGLLFGPVLGLWSSVLGIITQILVKSSKHPVWSWFMLGIQALFGWCGIWLIRHLTANNPAALFSSTNSIFRDLSKTCSYSQLYVRDSQVYWANLRNQAAFRLKDRLNIKGSQDN